MSQSINSLQLVEAT